MCIRNLRGTAKQSVMPGSAAALLASAGLLCTTGAATASTNNPQNGPAPAFQPNGPDLNGSGYVDFADLMMVLSVMSNPATVNPAWVTAADLNEDGVVDFADLSVLLSSFGQFIPPPPPEPPAPPPPPPEEPQFVSLVPGSGFWGPIADPGVVGDPNGYGGDAKVAARWNAIPGQFISGDFNVGVVAFHMSGINRVEFTANGGDVAVVEGASVNPTTGNTEYWVNIDTDDLDDGPVEIRAVAYPNNGIPRVLQGAFNMDSMRNGEYSLVLNVRNAEAPKVYVSHTGNDANPGTVNAPFKTIGRAIRLVPDGGEIILKDPGDYMSPQNGYGHMVRNHNDWITIRPADGLTRDDVTITDSARRIMRANASRLHWQDVTFDFAKVSQIYNTGDHMAWLDGVAMLDSDGWTVENRPPSLRNPWFATDCLAEDKLYAYAGATIVRNSVARQISGDVFQNTGLVIGCDVDNVDGAVLEHHTDLIQVFGARDNMIVADLNATNLNQVQSFFLEPSFEGTADESERWLSNSAFVNINIENTPVFRWSNNAGRMVNAGGAPWSQLLTRFDHVLFDNVDLANQRFMIRYEVTGLQAFHAKNVVFRDFGFHPDSYDQFYNNAASLPDGVQFVNCYSHPDVAEWTGD